MKQFHTLKKTVHTFRSSIFVIILFYFIIIIRNLVKLCGVQRTIISQNQQSESIILITVDSSDSSHLQGEEITISYIDNGKPTWCRQLELRGYHFLCHCVKCCQVEWFEGYRCTTKHCSGILRRKADCSTKYQYKQWLAGQCKVTHIVDKHSHSRTTKSTSSSNHNAVEVSVDSFKHLLLPIPYRNWLLLPELHLDPSTASASQPSTSANTAAWRTMSLYCAQCQSTVSGASLWPSIEAVLALAHQVHQLPLHPHLTSAEIRQHLRVCSLLMIQCDELIPEYHYVHQYCVSKLALVYQYLFVVHYPPSISIQSLLLSTSPIGSKQSPSSSSSSKQQSPVQHRANTNRNVLDICLLHQKLVETMELDLQERQVLYDTIHPTTICGYVQFLRQQTSLLSQLIVPLLQEGYPQSTASTAATSSKSNEVKQYCMKMIQLCRKQVQDGKRYVMTIQRCYSTQHEMYAEVLQCVQHLGAIQDSLQRWLSG